MRRMLFGLLTFVACAANAAAPAEDLYRMDELATSPLRKTLDAEGEAFPLALVDRRFDPRSNAGGAAEIGATLVDSTIFDRIGRRDEPVEPRSTRPMSDVANADCLGAPFWASGRSNIIDPRPNLNTSPGYQTIVEAITFPGWFGAAAQVRTWRMDQENRRLDNGVGLGTPWEWDFAPSSQTMFSVKGFYSDVFRTSLFEMKPGYVVIDSFSFAAFAAEKIYIGPFAVLTGHWRDKFAKAGLQMTFGKIGAFTLTFAGGLARDRYAGAGAFGVIESSLRF